ncbi:alpha/beta hydrolase [Brucella grignonensis]|nr:alpha/beta fold hydrolase [Brucella grignonensis]
MPWRVFTPRSSKSCRKWTILFLMMALAGCAARPGPQTLDPVASNPQGIKSIIIFAATDRSPTEAKPSVLGDGRGNLTYEQFTMQPVGMATRGKEDATALSRESDPSKDFITTGRRQLDKASFEQSIDRMRKADEMIAVFVHGYNTSYQEAVFRLAQLSTDARVVPVLFSWPSMADFRGYVADRDATTYARDDLVRLLIMLSRSRPSGRIAVVGHSMGGWLVMEALRQLRLEGRDDVIARLQVGLASPDIDIDVFRRQAAVVGRLSPPLTVLISKDDRALAVSSRLAGGKPRLGLASGDDPQIQEIAHQSGAQIIDISTLPAGDVFNHDRFVVFASRYAAAAQRDGSVGGARQAGVFLLDTTGRILSLPFEGTARIIAGSQ